MKKGGGGVKESKKWKPQSSTHFQNGKKTKFHQIIFHLFACSPSHSPDLLVNGEIQTKLFFFFLFYRYLLPRRVVLRASLKRSIVSRGTSRQGRVFQHERKLDWLHRFRQSSSSDRLDFHWWYRRRRRSRGQARAKERDSGPFAFRCGRLSARHSQHRVQMRCFERRRKDY